MPDPYQGIRVPDPDRARHLASVFDPSPIERVAEAMMVAAEVDPVLFVEEVGGLYRWSPVHRGGGYPLLRITAKFLKMDYRRLIVGFRPVLDGYTALSRDPTNEPESDASAIVATDWKFSAEAKMTQIRRAMDQSGREDEVILLDPAGGPDEPDPDLFPDLQCLAEVTWDEEPWTLN